MAKSQGEEQLRDKLVFLSDQPLDADTKREMQFGHTSIVENLEEIISSCPTPFSIGLFGKWGTGKTSILEILKEKLNETKIAVTKFDVWKHEDDALRRTFLLDTVTQLQNKHEKKQYLDEKFKLEENLNKSFSETLQNKIKFNNSMILPLGIISLVLIGVALLINKFWTNNLGTYITTILSGGLLSGIIVWWLTQYISTITITKTYDIFQDPYQFETEFKRIVKEVKAQKLLIIIDNLDRVSCEKAVELLSTIKTFLEQHQCVFLIACDAEAIKKHIEKQYHFDLNNTQTESIISGDEFLRKFFNCYLVIPDFIDVELQTYTEKLLNKTHLDSDEIPDIAYVISKAFRNNPRQIKQFINTLLSHLLLAVKREHSGELVKGVVTNNLTYLAKDLVLRLQFPQYYNLETRPNFSSKELDNFLNSTTSVRVQNDKAFRYLKQSDIEMELPEIKELQNALMDKDIEAVTKILSIFMTNLDKLELINKTIISLINQNKNSKLVTINIISSLLTSINKLELKLNKYFYHEVANILSNDKVMGFSIQEIAPRLIFSEILNRCEQEKRQKIMLLYTFIFADPQKITQKDADIYRKSLLVEFIGHKKWIDNEMASQIGLAISQRHSNFEYLSLFTDKSIEHKDLIMQDTINNFITGFNERDVETPGIITEKINLLINFNKIISSDLLVKFLSHFSSLLAIVIQKGDENKKRILLDCTYQILVTFGVKMVNIDINTRNHFTQQLLNGISAVGPLASKRIFVPSLLLLTEITSDQIKNQIDAIINGFFSSASSEDINNVMDVLKTKENKQEIIGKYGAVFINRVIHDPNIFDMLYPLATENKKTEWVTNLINHNPEMAVSKLEKLNYKVDNRKAIVQALLDKANQIQPIRQRESLYNACNKMKCANDTELKERFIGYIKNHLIDPNHDTQKVGLTMLQATDYLSQTQRRGITTETVDWLSTLQPNNIFQPSSIKSPLVTWQDLTKPLQQKYLDIVFSKLIIRGIDSRNIDLGFQILNSIQPTPEYSDSDNSKYYDDVLVRILNPNEPNKEIKLRLLNGLKNLQPTKLSKDNKDYWEKVNNIPIQ